MNDTSPEVIKIYREMLMSLSNEERLIRGAGMFDACRELALASLKEELSDTDKKIFLFQRFYGVDFNDKDKEAFIKRLRKKQIKNYDF